MDKALEPLPEKRKRIFEPWSNIRWRT